VLTIHHVDHARVDNIYRMQSDDLASDTGLKSCRSFFLESVIRIEDPISGLVGPASSWPSTLVPLRWLTAIVASSI
jgi:hypothetical protein